MPIKMSITNTRTFQVPIPASQQDTETLGIALKQAGEEGFNITLVQPLNGGHQRDPYIIGLKITVGKP